jgi:hypothetical protein
MAARNPQPDRVRQIVSENFPLRNANQIIRAAGLTACPGGNHDDGYAWIVIGCEPLLENFEPID